MKALRRAVRYSPRADIGRKREYGSIEGRMRIDILGNYRIGNEPWRLIEFQASDLEGPLDFDSFALPVPGQPRSNWQVPLDERVLSESERGDLRGCFFLFVESDEALQTPAGPVPLPPASERPTHLDFVQFEDPC